MNSRNKEKLLHGIIVATTLIRIFLAAGFRKTEYVKTPCNRLLYKGLVFCERTFGIPRLISLHIILPVILIILSTVIFYRLSVRLFKETGNRVLFVVTAQLFATIGNASLDLFSVAGTPALVSELVLPLLLLLAFRFENQIQAVVATVEEKWNEKLQKWKNSITEENQETDKEGSFEAFMKSKKGIFVMVVCCLMIPFMALTGLCIYKLNQKINSVFTITQELKDMISEEQAHQLTVSGVDAIVEDKWKEEQEKQPEKFLISRFTESDGMSFVTCDTGSNEIYRVYQLDMNEDAGGLGYVIEMPDGGLTVIDGGYYGDGVSLKKFLVKHGGTVNAWILTHPHYDHIGAFLYCMKEGSEELTVKNVYYSPFTEEYANSAKMLQDELEYEAFDYADFMEIVKAPGKTAFVPLNTGDVLELAGLKVTCLWSFTDTMPDVNDNSLVVRFDMGKVSMLITGDVTEKAIDAMIRLLGKDTELLDTDFVQIPHHGYEGCGEKLFQYCQPRFALLDCSTREYTNNILNIQSGTAQMLHENGVGILKRFEGTNVIVVK